MSLAIIAGLYACFALSPGKPVLAAPRAAAVVLEQEQPAGSGQTPAQTQPAQEPAKAGDEGSSAPPTAPQQQQTSSSPQTTNPQPAQSGQPQSVAPAQSKPKPASRKKTGSKISSKPATKKPAAKKAAVAATTGKPAAKNSVNGPAKVVVRDGGTADPEVELAPTVPKQQANAALQNTNRLLDATEANLKQLSSRQLSATQQDMVKQIRAYMQQARAAADADDVQQAETLAGKARMLSDELVKQ